MTAFARAAARPRAHALDGPTRAGLSFKHSHAAAIAADTTFSGFFEVHAENYMGAGGMPHHLLTNLRQDHPLSLHGVSTSIGGTHALDPMHLKRFGELVRRYEPFVVSEHLAWSTHGSTYFNDLLPLPYTRQTLDTVCDHVDQVQDVLGQTLLLENPSTYVVFAQSDISEVAFLREVTQRTGCRLLLDVNNAWVSAINHGRSANEYIDEFPLDQVAEIHLAGHAVQADEEGRPLLIDSHDEPVAAAVWKLYERVLNAGCVVPTLIEWDSKLPEWSRLRSEAHAADVLFARAARRYFDTEALS